MIGVNELKSSDTIPTETIIALCDGLLAKREEPDMRRLLRTDKDRYYRTFKTQFKRLDDRYPQIFMSFLQYGRTLPDGVDLYAAITDMLYKRDSIFAKMENDPELTREEAGDVEDRDVDYVYARQYVRPAIGADRFDSIVKPPGQTE